MKAFAFAVAAATMLTSACESRSRTVDGGGGSGRTTDPISSPRGDVLAACKRVESAMQARGARRVSVADSVDDSTAFNPRQGACVVLADSFVGAPRGDLFQATPLDSGWTWHPFEGDGGQKAYGIVRDSVQCEVTPRDSATRFLNEEWRRRASSFHVFCYPA